MSRLNNQVRLDGFEATIRMTKRAQQEVPQVARRALYDLTTKILLRAKELCPVSDPDGPRSHHHGDVVPSGFLVNSARMDVVGDEASGTARAIVGFWAEYAVYVHEVPAAHANGRQWKYLEAAVTELMPLMPQYLAEVWSDWFRHWTAGAFYGAVGSVPGSGVSQWVMPSEEFGNAPYGLGNTPP